MKRALLEPTGGPPAIAPCVVGSPVDSRSALSVGVATLDDATIAACIASHHAAERMGIPRERRSPAALAGAKFVAAMGGKER